MTQKINNTFNNNTKIMLFSLLKISKDSIPNKNYPYKINNKASLIYDNIINIKKDLNNHVLKIELKLNEIRNF